MPFTRFRFWLAAPLFIAVAFCLSAVALAQENYCVQDTTQVNYYDGCNGSFDLGVTQGPWTWHYHFDTFGGLGACTPLVYTDCDCSGGRYDLPAQPWEEMEAPVFWGCDYGNGGSDWQVTFDIHEYEWVYPASCSQGQCPSAQGMPTSQEYPYSPSRYGPYQVSEPECFPPGYGC